MLHLPTLADRVWYAYHCLARNSRGELPSYRELEKEHGLPQATFTRTIRGTRTQHHRGTIPKLARALNVTEAWLDYGGTNAPMPTGPVPARPGTTATEHGELPGWNEAVGIAKQGRQVIPPEAFRAGARMPIYRPVDHITPRLATAVSYYAWQTSTKAEQTKYSTEEARAATAGIASLAKARRRVS